jgi:hypothetical protein
MGIRIGTLKLAPYRKADGTLGLRPAWIPARELRSAAPDGGRP